MSSLRWPPNHVERWLPVDPPVRSVYGSRSGKATLDCARQFDVERCQRYQPTDGQTWCSVFVWDVSRALGVEIPHWVNGAGSACPVGQGRELNANAVIGWLHGSGARHGWIAATLAQAQHVAALGCPTVATWANANTHGHIAVVLPSRGELLIAQAGLSCFSSGTLRAGFGSHVDEVEFWYHA